MANITSTRSSSPGSVQEGANFKRQMVIDWTDIVALTIPADGDTVTFTIPVSAGEEVTRVGVRLVDAFDDSGGGDELNVEVGDGADANGYITTAALHTDQSEITWVSDTGAFITGGAANRGKLYVVDDTVDILITPDVSTGTPYNLNELTEGNFIVTVIGHSYA